jgi:hypothetical protein
MKLEAFLDILELSNQTSTDNAVISDLDGNVLGILKSFGIVYKMGEKQPMYIMEGAARPTREVYATLVGNFKFKEWNANRQIESITIKWKDDAET